MAMSAGYIPFHPNPSKPKYKPPAGAVDAHCHVFGPESEVSLRARAQIHALRRAQGEAVRAARFSRLRQERDRAGVLPQQGQSGDGRCARRFQRQGQGRGLRRRGGHRRRAQGDGPRRRARACASISSSGWSISRRARCCERIAARIAPLGWHIVIYFEMPDLPELESVLHLAADHGGGRSHGHAGREEGRRSPGEPALPPLMEKHRNFWVKVTCPERMTRRRAALRRRGAVRAGPGGAISRPRASGAPIGRIPT